MLNSLINQSHSSPNIFPLHAPFLAARDAATHHSSSSAYSSPPAVLRQPIPTKKSNATRTTRPASSAGKIKALKNPFLSNVTRISGFCHTKSTYLLSLKPSRIADDITDFLWTSLLFEFVSNDLDSKGKPKTVKTGATYDAFAGEYNFHFDVPDDFGEIGAVLVENDYRNELFLEKIVVFDNVTFTCNAWLHCKNENPERRIFFADKCYLPSQMPKALKELREKDLEFLRGDGVGERQSWNRIYDYDVYNDLGDPDTSLDLARPVLGGKKFPYPRRCRTGRKMSTKDPLTESRIVKSSLSGFYVPIDEDFSEIKTVTFGARTLYNVLKSVIPLLDTDEDFVLFHEVDSLFDEGVKIQGADKGLATLLPRLVDEVTNATDPIIKFNAPEPVRRDSFFWLRDEEFCRQTLAGLNPCSIQLVTEWPIMSALDCNVYGPAESAFTKEIVERQLKDFMTLEEVINDKQKAD